LYLLDFRRAKALRSFPKSKTLTFSAASKVVHRSSTLFDAAGKTLTSSQAHPKKIGRSK
jgi:hypothetical protein